MYVVHLIAPVASGRAPVKRFATVDAFAFATLCWVLCYPSAPLGLVLLVLLLPIGILASYGRFASCGRRLS